MDYDKLKPKVAEVLVEHPDWTDQQIADSLNVMTVTEVFDRRCNERDILAEFPTADAGRTFLEKLETFGQGSSNAAKLVARSLRWLLPNQEGINFGHERTRQQLDALATAAVITQDEADAAKGMAERLVSWATANGLRPVNGGDVYWVRTHMGD